MAPVPVTDFFGRPRLMSQPVQIDEATLKEIADKTAGMYFRAVDEHALASIYREIDQLERTEVTEVKYLQYTEHYAYFVLPGLCLMGMAWLLSGSVLRRLP